MVALPRNSGSESSRVASNDQSSGPLARVTQVFTLFAGAAVIVYITGGVVLALRLGFDNLPYSAVVGQLPREFLISQGLGLVVLPVAAGAALYVVYRVIGQEPRRPTLVPLSSSVGLSRRLTWGYVKSVAKDMWRGRKLLSIAAVVSAVLILPALIHEIIKQPEWRWGLAYFMLAYFITFISTTAILQIRALLVQRHFKWEEDRGSWSSARLIAAMTALYAAAILPGAIAFGATVPLLNAKVCRTSGALEGSLIGETSDKLYLGLGDAKQNDRQIVVIPYDQVRQLYAGGDAKETACPPQVGTAAGSNSTSSGATGATGATGPQGTTGSDGRTGQPAG